MSNVLGQHVVGRGGRAESVVQFGTASKTDELAVVRVGVAGLLVPSAMPLEPKLVVEAFDRAVDTGDVAALDAVCHPDIITHSLSDSMPQGIEGIRRFVAGSKARGGVGEWEEVVTVAEGEYVVQFGTRSLNWPGGPFRGFDVPVGAFRRDCAFMFRVRDGLITDRWAIRDDLAMMTQLGAVTAPRPDQVMDGTVTSKREHPFR